MSAIKNIVFDFGGVLLDWNPRYLYKDYFKDEKEMEYFLSEICNSEWNVQQDAGRPFAEAVKLLQAQYPQYSEAIRMYDEYWYKMLKCEFPESIALLKELKSLGYGIYGLPTNSISLGSSTVSWFPVMKRSRNRIRKSTGFFWKDMAWYRGSASSLTTMPTM